ncbi:peptidylprolyl isomerase [Halopseudomonas salegens]|uniref:Peptidyl-prolyl cis-trans isomerase n=1 Tax=Halopseudomonas salegens TaxID=1434072 RepID=A0A1H2EY97_9GAMM|nr:peptidylprolyl isomerase [Halopseudomonas salegens]SDU00055.1 peptidyl-prolyl cis-trans isomerase A (cyclophilin A) [Halopseudomonas salegens]
MLKTLLACLTTLLLLNSQLVAAEETRPQVTLHTSLGDITLELNAEKAPISVANFLRYVDAGHYEGLLFHRVIPGFMIQGGGFTPDMRQRDTVAAIKNEADNGLRNRRYTVAMARTSVVDSATSQFFINLSHNDFLDHNPGNFGYAVFGQVIEGQHVVETIAKVPTTTQGGHGDVPVNPVVIERISRIAGEKREASEQ